MSKINLVVYGSILLTVTGLSVFTVINLTNECNTYENETTREIYKIYQTIDSMGYIKCHEFKNICEEDLCTCIDKAGDVFKYNCFTFTKNIVDSQSECFTISDVIKGCNVIVCK